MKALESAERAMAMLELVERELACIGQYELASRAKDVREHVSALTVHDLSGEGYLMLPRQEDSDG